MKKPPEKYQATTITVVPSTLKLDALKEPAGEPYVPLYNRAHVPNRPEPKKEKRCCWCFTL